MKFYLCVYAVALVVYAAVAWPHTHPPYIDSFYYVDIARNLARGQGFTEGFVWNYLSGAPPIPHPSSAYWLPGLSVLLAPAFLVGTGYRGAALLTAAIAALLPLLAARIGCDLFGTRRHALTMAALTLFSGIWFHDWTTPDAFVPAAILTATTLLLASHAVQGRGPWRGGLALSAAGATASLDALTRQEGALLAPALLLAVVLTRGAPRRLWPRGLVGAAVLYGAVQAPWLWHNLIVLGATGASGGSRTLWMRSYDAFYALRTDALTSGAYLRWGLGNIVAARLHAIVFTLEVWAALWLVVLVPPLLVGLWQLRRRVKLRPFFCYWAILALSMPLLFTATIEHGTLLHASGGLLPFTSALIVGGIDGVAAAVVRVTWARRRKGRRECEHLDAATAATATGPVEGRPGGAGRSLRCSPVPVERWDGRDARAPGHNPRPQSSSAAMRHMRTGPRPAPLYGLAPGRLRPVPVQPAAAGPGPGPVGQSQALASRVGRVARDLDVLAVALAVLVSLVMTARTFPAHGDEYTHDTKVAAWLHAHNPRGAPVMVLDPPLFSYLDDGAYVVAPSDGIGAVLAVAHRYGVRYWALDPLEAPYAGTRIHAAGLSLVGTVDGVLMYRVGPSRVTARRVVGQRG